MNLLGTNKKILYVARKYVKVGEMELPILHYPEYTGFALMKVTDYHNLKNTLKIGNLTPTSKLFFSKTSKVPRIKLQNTELQRCIKIEKADFVVIPDTLNFNLDYTSAYEDDTTVYLMSSYSNESMFLSEHPNIQRINCGFAVLSKNAEETIKLMQNSNLTFIYDKEVNKMIDKNSSPITIDDLNSIKEMINSETDSEIVGLGLKTLASLNVSEFPLTVKTFLMLNNHRWPYNSAKQQVDVKNMLSSIGLLGWSRFSFPYDFRYLNKDKTYSDEDRAMAKILMKDKIQKELSERVESILDVCQLYDIDVKINIE